MGALKKGLPLAATTSAVNEVDFGSHGRFCVTQASQELLAVLTTVSHETRQEELMSENEPFVSHSREIPQCHTPPPVGVGAVRPSSRASDW